MKIEKIDHIHIAVEDLKKAAKSFSDIMGTKWVGPIESSAMPGMKTTFDTLGFELVQPTSPDSPLAKFIQKRGEGVYSIGLKVSNLDETIADLEARGVRVVWRGSGKDFNNESIRGVALTNPKDTHGVMFELLEYDEWTPISLANLDRLADIPSPI